MNRLAIFALVLAGFCWGTTGLFVRALSEIGLGVHDLLIVRLFVMGVFILPVYFVDRIRSKKKKDLKTTAFVGLSMLIYYLGAIAAFQNLQLVVAALIIGSSPLIAWLLPLIIEFRVPKLSERKQGIGVAIAMIGLGLLGYANAGMTSTAPATAIAFYGYIGGIVSALVTVLNARLLNRLGTNAPQPIEIASATVVFGLLISPFFISSSGHETFYGLEIIFLDMISHPWLCLGFGLIATTIPGLAIVFASKQLNPQTTATVSIQLQIWSGILAWIVLGETMSAMQIAAALMMIVGSWFCIAHAKVT